jgi:hypothetical protein
MTVRKRYGEAATSSPEILRAVHPRAMSHSHGPFRAAKILHDLAQSGDASSVDENDYFHVTRERRCSRGVIRIFI